MALTPEQQRASEILLDGVNLMIQRLINLSNDLELPMSILAATRKELIEYKEIRNKLQLGSYYLVSE